MDREIHFAREARCKRTAAVSDHFPEPQFHHSARHIERNADSTLFENECLRVFGNEFQQFDVAPVASFVDRLG